LWWIFACKLSLLALIIRVLSGNFSHKAIWLALYAVWLDVAFLLNYKSLDK
jgi:hypothetical protein